MGEAKLRRLPSLDWLAFGIGMGAMVLHYLWPPLLAVVALAVFAPSVLRELGIIRDADEYTLGVMRRAGFHAALAAGALIFLDHGLAVLGLYPGADMLAEPMILGSETLRKALIWVFLISYLIQYWGARGGVARVLLGAAIMTLAPVAFLLRPGDYPWPGTLVAAACGSAGAMVALAWIVSRAPRAGGILLVSVCVAGLAALATTGLADPRARWGVISVMLQAALIFGVTGLALLRETKTKEAEL